MNLYLKRHNKYGMSKLKHLNFLNKARNFNFDLTKFWYPSRYRVICYLIGNLLLVIKTVKKSKLKHHSWKIPICYINGALLILNCYELYIKWWQCSSDKNHETIQDTSSLHMVDKIDVVKRKKRPLFSKLFSLFEELVITISQRCDIRVILSVFYSFLKTF